MSQIAAIVGIILFTVFFLGLCIFVHELGHLLVALWRGLYVERFSIGFGRKIWGVTRNGVEYIVSMLPFGGYVALPQLDPTEEPHTSDGRPLPAGRAFDRMLTAFAGPISNLVFGFVLAAFVWWIGVYTPAPSSVCEVYKVKEESPEYKAGLRPGDRIVAVNGRTFTQGFGELSERILLSSGEIELAVRRGDEQLSIDYQPAPNPETEGLGYPFFDCRVPTIVHRVVEGSPAAQAGLQPGDEILSVNGETVPDPNGFINRVQESNGTPLRVRILRQGEELEIPDLRAKSEETDEGSVFRIGAVVDAPRVLSHPTPWQQFTKVLSMTQRTLKLLFVPGSLVKPRHLSGPVGILLSTGIKLYLGGLREGLSFVVFISFSLALLNLFPIPVLDGGHILFAFIELVTRRRFPVRVAYALQMAFAGLLVAFMLYVTFYDFARVGRTWKIFNPPTEETQPASPAPGTTTPPQPDATGAESPAVP